MIREKVEEIPLGHEGHKFALRRDVAEVGRLEGGISDDNSHRLNPLMGYLEELPEQAKFAEHFERGGVHGVAAKVAVEVLVLFEHRDFNTLARQQIREHHARGPAADDTATCFHNR